MPYAKIHPSTIRGSIQSQPSKSNAHRVIICAALAEGQTKIDNLVLSDDIIATLNAAKAFGAHYDISDSTNFTDRKKITINSPGRVILREKVIDCHESGSTARFIMPITRLSEDNVKITGRNRLIERPFDVYRDIFIEKGINYRDSDGKMPICLSGKLVPGEYFIKGDVSSQFISGLLFALPLLEQSSTIKVINRLESLPYIHMTLETLSEFGIDIMHDKDYMEFHIPGGQKYRTKQSYVIEGDWSQAAFFCVAGQISGPISIEGLNIDSKQGDKVILDILKKMGGSFTFEENRIRFEKSKLNGIDIDVSQCPDIVPAISVAGSLAKGTTRILNGARLRIKESDRLMTTCRELRALGANISEEPDGLIIQGTPQLNGGLTNGCGDHRIVMAIAIASTACKDSVEIMGSEAVNKSYPDFWKDFTTLGGKVELI